MRDETNNKFTTGSTYKFLLEPIVIQNSDGTCTEVTWGSGLFVTDPSKSLQVVPPTNDK